MEYNLGECKTYAAKFSKNSPNLLLFGSTGLGKTFLSTCIAEAVSARGFSVAYDTAINIVAAYETIKFGSGDGEAPQNALHATSAPICSLSTIWHRNGYCLYGFRAVQPDQQPSDG